MHQQHGDIPDPGAARTAGAPVIGLRAPLQPQPASRGIAEPVALRFGPPKVVTREHTNNAVRWKQGERLNQLLERACERFAENEAVVTEGVVLTYRDLDRRANQVTRYLIAAGIKPGDRVGLLFDRSL